VLLLLLPRGRVQVQLPVALTGEFEHPRQVERNPLARVRPRQYLIGGAGDAEPVHEPGVDPGASDGRTTELLGDSLKVGDEVIVDVIEKS